MRKDNYFDSCPPAPGFDPAIWRLDLNCRLIRRHDAATHSRYGWYGDPETGLALHWQNADPGI